MEWSVDYIDQDLLRSLEKSLYHRCCQPVIYNRINKCHYTTCDIQRAFNTSEHYEADSHTPQYFFYIARNGKDSDLLSLYGRYKAPECFILSNTWSVECMCLCTNPIVYCSLLTMYQLITRLIQKMQVFLPRVPTKLSNL